MNEKEMNTEEDKCEEVEYRNNDKIGFSIRMDSNVDDLRSQYGKEAIEYAIKALGKISYTLESTGIRFPLSEESGKAIVEKWIYLLERKKEKNGNK